MTPRSAARRAKRLCHKAYGLHHTNNELHTSSTACSTQSTEPLVFVIIREMAQRTWRAFFKGCRPTRRDARVPPPLFYPTGRVQPYSRIYLVMGAVCASDACTKS